MSIPLFFTNKYIRSNKDSKFISLISLIAMIGIALGVTVLIIALTVLDGFESAVSKKIINLNSHIKVTAFGRRNLPDYQTTIDSLNQKFPKQIKSISPFIVKDAIIKSKRLSEGISLLGITNQNKYSGLEDYLIEGKVEFNHTTGSLPAMIIGKKLAEKLFLTIGDKVTIFTLSKNQLPSEDNPPVIEQFIIGGIYESGMSEYDDLKAYADLKFLQSVFFMGSAVSGFDIKIEDIEQIESLSSEIKEYLHYPHYVRSIYKVHHAIFSWIDLQKEPIPIVLGLIILVAVFNIVGTLLMMVLERTNDIGLLRSLGAQKKDIVKIFVYQGTVLSLIGILAGNLLSLALSYIQIKFNIISLPDTVYFLSKVPMIINFKVYIGISLLTLALCIAASLIPSIIAAKIKPIKAIRFD